MVVSVDLPIPGAPPISTIDPATSPPPSTTSSSPMPVPIRACSPAATSARTSGRIALARSPPPRPALALGSRTSSTSVFHSPQPAQRPSQRALWCPQAEHTKTEPERAIAATLGKGADVKASTHEKLQNWHTMGQPLLRIPPAATEGELHGHP